MPKEFIYEKTYGQTTAEKDPGYRGALVRCGACIYFKRDEGYNRGKCLHHGSFVTRRDFCSKAKMDAIRGAKYD